MHYINNTNSYQINKKFTKLCYHKNRGDVMDKRGTSIIELMAIIVIMGIIAGIGTVSAIAIINRQRKNKVIGELNSIYRTAKGILFQTTVGDNDDLLHNIDDDFYYLKLSDMVENAYIEGRVENTGEAEVYFCFDTNETFVIITSGNITKGKPTSTGSTTINDELITFDYDENKFVGA